MNGKLMPGLVACVSGADANEVIRVGECYAYLDEPSYCMKDANGRHFSWAHTLVREATAEEQLEYWRNRALASEKSNQRIIL